MGPILAQAILAASGRYAIMARADVDAPWVQVESVRGRAEADDYIDHLENDDAARESACRDFADEDWGEDAPPEDWE